MAHATGRLNQCTVAVPPLKAQPSPVRRATEAVTQHLTPGSRRAALRAACRAGLEAAACEGRGNACAALSVGSGAS